MVSFLIWWVGLRAVIVVLAMLISFVALKRALAVTRSGWPLKSPAMGVTLLLVILSPAMWWLVFLDTEGAIRQLSWARQYDVGLGGFPAFTEDFPRRYFQRELAPGMTLSEVHAMVHGYANAGSCGDRVERYYYYSNPSDWDRDRPTFDIVFDQDRRFQRLIIYDDSAYFGGLPSCREGLLSE